MTYRGESTSDSETEKEKVKGLISPKQKKHWETITNPLQAYLKDTKQYPLLTQEKEKEIFQRYQEFRNPKDKELLIVSNLRLVVKIAFKYYKFFSSVPNDLIQEGNIGLMRAVEKYDLGKKVKFSYYAAFWIKAYILNYIINNWSLVKFVTTEPRRKLFTKLNGEKDRLRKLGIDPDAKTIAENLDVETKDVRDMEKFLNGGDLSLDAPLKDEGDSSWVEFESDNTDVEKMVSDKDILEKGRELLKRFRQTLNERELIIFDNRMCCETALTLQEVGDKLGISRERVRQIEKNIRKKLFDFKRKEDNCMPRLAERPENVTCSEISELFQEGGKTKKIALLYFGLSNGKGEMEAKEISEEINYSKRKVDAILSQVRKKINQSREKKEKEGVVAKTPDAPGEKKDPGISPVIRDNNSSWVKNDDMRLAVKEEKGATTADPNKNIATPTREKEESTSQIQPEAKDKSPAPLNKGKTAQSQTEPKTIPTTEGKKPNSPPREEGWAEKETSPLSLQEKESKTSNQTEPEEVSSPREKEVSSSPEKSKTTEKADSSRPLRLVVERGGKKFEMNLSGGPIYDLLVKYLGL